MPVVHCRYAQSQSAPVFIVLAYQRQIMKNFHQYRQAILSFQCYELFATKQMPIFSLLNAFVFEIHDFTPVQSNLISSLSLSHSLSLSLNLFLSLSLSLSLYIYICTQVSFADMHPRRLATQSDWYPFSSDTQTCNYPSTMVSLIVRHKVRSKRCVVQFNAYLALPQSNSHSQGIIIGKCKGKMLAVAPSHFVCITNIYNHATSTVCQLAYMLSRTTMVFGPFK